MCMVLFHCAEEYNGVCTIHISGYVNRVRFQSRKKDVYSHSFSIQISPYSITYILAYSYCIKLSSFMQSGLTFLMLVVFTNFFEFLQEWVQPTRTGRSIFLKVILVQGGPLYHIWLSLGTPLLFRYHLFIQLFSVAYTFALAGRNMECAAFLQV